MKSPLFIAVAAVVVLVFLVNMTTYQVDFTEKAVLATFGRVTETGVKEEPGLKFKLPAPLQTVTTYDRRARLIEVTNVQVSTTDAGTLVANAFLTWRVSEPLVFYRRFNEGGVGSDPESQYEAAEETLETQLRNVVSEVVGEYALDQIFAEGDGASALPAIEADMLARIQRRLSGDTAESAGVEVQMVGVSRLVFPETVSEQVINRMAQFRQSIAENARQEGEAEATSIRSGARDTRDRILAFAQNLASQLRSEGDLEAARWYQQLNEAPELAEFLAYTRLFTEEGLGRTLTLVLPLDAFGAEFFSPEYRERLIEAGRMERLGEGSDASEEREGADGR